MHARKLSLSRILFLVLTVAVAIVLFAMVPNAQAQEGDPPSTPIPEIVGGAASTPGEWPWQVALVVGDATGPDFFLDQFCGGSLIHSQWVLTAGHCVTDPVTGNVEAASTIDIVAGIYDLRNPVSGYQQRNVSQIFRHPSYDAQTLDNDIALLKLASPVTIGGSGESTTALVPLVPSGIGSLAGTNAWVTGWGNTQSTPEFPDELYEAQVPIIANTTCNNASHYNGDITDNMLCAGYDLGGVDSCQGDSGGPLVINNSGQWQLAGVVSWGEGCAEPNRPGVYARVSRYVTWINQNISPAIPGAATLVTPSGSIGNNNPTYTWNEVSAASWYYLWVNGPSGNIYNAWFSAAQYCSGGTCSVSNVTPNLGGGTHTWWIQTWNESGYGPWSAGKTFTPPTPTLPGKATLSSPNGSIGNNNPTYTWNQVSNATWYYLWVDGPSGHVFHQWYNTAQANCNGSTCSVAGATPNLSGGTHTWWIQTWNDVGYGPWSNGMSFTPPTPTLPGAATLVTPSGSIGNNNPTYNWNQVSGATYYYLWVDGPSGHILDKWYTSAEAGCNGSTCSVAGATPNLSGGTHTWWIQTWNPVGYGPWSSGKTFTPPTPTLPGAATLVTPSGSIGNNNPTYTWNEVSAATWYYLWVDGPTDHVFHQWYNTAQANCNGSTCSVAGATPNLISGAHNWYIQTWSSAGYGPWSAGKTFTPSDAAGFSSQFNGSSTGWTAYYGSWSIDSSQWYHGVGDGTYYVSSGYSGTNYANFDVQTRVATDTPHEAYLIVRGTPTPLDAAKDWNSGYFFGFDVNGFYMVGKMVNGSWSQIQPWTVTSSLNQGGAWNVLRVVASGNNLYYYINGTLVWSGTDSSLTTGKVGFELGTDPIYGLWVDWITLTSSGESLQVITDTVSPEQQALNDAAKAKGSDKTHGGYHK